MIQATNFIELNKHCSTAIKELNAAMSNFSGTFKNLPLSETVKNKRVNATVKEKAAWFACIVNPNIDILLLPDYLESKQSRNILLKKETDQFQAAVQNFPELSSLNSNAALYENLLTQKEEEQSSYDLFSRHVKVKAKCPEALTNRFNHWMIVSTGESEFENFIHQFCDWHAANNYSFTGQRNFILWMNYQLWKLFGDAALLFNIEQHFYHHWNRESRSNVQSVKELVHFLLEACIHLQSELKTIYREEIGYESFEPLQRLANNFIYHSGFNVPLMQKAQADDYSSQLNKVMLKKGFVRSADINFKVQLEKVKLTLQNWYQTGLIQVVFTENNWLAYLLPSEGKTKRLQSYCNLQYQSVEPDWEMVFIKPTIQIQSVKEAVVEEAPRKVVVRQKAFFG